MTVTLTEPMVDPGTHGYGALKVWAASHLTFFFFFSFYRPGMVYSTKCNIKEGSNGESIEQAIKMKRQNGHKSYLINNYLKCQCIKCSN